jgi:ABC-type transport system involved in multi-copper enzyme maturation permease subunit
VARSEPLSEPALPSFLGRSVERTSAGAPVVSSLFRRELQRIGDGARYPLIALLVIALMVLAAVTEGARYRSRVKAQEVILGPYQRELAEVTVAGLADKSHPAVKPPWRLAFAVDGGESIPADVYHATLSPFLVPSLESSLGDDDGLPGSTPLDWMFAIRTALALGAFLLGYDAICGDRERGTLKILLSYPVTRGQVLLAKFLALVASVAVPFLAGAALSLDLVALQGIRFAGEEWSKVGMTVTLGLAATACWSLAALLVSALHRSSAASLSVLLLLWVGIAVAVPAMGGLLARGFVPIEGDEAVARKLATVEGRIAVLYPNGKASKWRKPEEAKANGYDLEKISIEAQARRLRMRDDVRRQAFGGKLAQARAARRFASVSPASLFDDLAERLTGAGLWREESFLAQAAAFQKDLATAVSQADLKDPVSPHLHFAPSFLSARPMPETAIPRFHFRERTVAEGLAAARPLLALLALELALLAAAAGFFFARYEAG